MITRLLSLLLIVALFSSVVWNREGLEHYTHSLNLTADVSDIVYEISERDTLMEVCKPTFMQHKKKNNTELTTQVRVGYFLLRGF
jgi:hypothetical protein